MQQSGKEGGYALAVEGLRLLAAHPLQPGLAAVGRHIVAAAAVVTADGEGGHLPGQADGVALPGGLLPEPPHAGGGVVEFFPGLPPKVLLKRGGNFTHIMEQTGQFAQLFQAQRAAEGGAELGHIPAVLCQGLDTGRLAAVRAGADMGDRMYFHISPLLMWGEKFLSWDTI